MNSKIDEILDIKPEFVVVEDNPVVPFVEESLPVEVPDVNNPEIVDEDFEEVRNNLKDLIDKGARAADEMFSIAQQSQNPKAYEALSTMISTMINANKQLMETHKQAREAKGRVVKAETPVGDTNVTNNIVFGGSTAELLKLMKQQLT